jgi:hypothetical protein
VRRAMAAGFASGAREPCISSKTASTHPQLSLNEKPP